MRHPKTKKTRSYWEPWRPAPSETWRVTFGDEPPPVDDADVLERWRSARDRARENADWLIWGSTMFEPSVTTAFVSGDPVVSDDGHILARFSRPHTDNPKPPTQGEIATRVAECVNALAGVSDPVALVAATRDLLHKLVDVEGVLPLLARWIPCSPIYSVDPTEAEP